MSTISNTITHGITLSSSGSYASPLTITPTGYVQNTGSDPVIYGPLTQAWTVANYGRVTQSNPDPSNLNQSGIVLRSGGLITNTGTITAPVLGVFIGKIGTLTNSGIVESTGTSKVAVWLAYGGGVTNTSSGLISGNVRLDRYGSIINFGTISVGGLGGEVDLLSGGNILNSSTGLISASNGVLFNSLGTLTNAGTIRATGTASIYGGVHLSSGTVVNSGTIDGGAAGTAVSFGGFRNLLVLETGYKLSGIVQGSTFSTQNTLALAGAIGAAVTADYNTLRLQNFQYVRFDGYAALDVANIAGTFPLMISGLDAPTETIDLTQIGTDGTISNTDTANRTVTISGSNGAVTLRLAPGQSSDLATASDGVSGTDVAVVCFCRGTLILTDKGEVPVEELAVGDRVINATGIATPIRWIGVGRELVTRRNRLARPIIVRHGALADDVPHRDLYLTHGHALYLDRVLIPVENLINHRSILWDETAQVVEFFHIELEDHDVLFANGAPAESYYDASNRARFHNTRPGSAPGEAKPACAPVVSGGPVVERAWTMLFERSGGRIARHTTDDPDLHLVIGRRRIEPTTIEDRSYSFALAGPPTGRLLICSRSGVPSLVGVNAHDHRRLGVALACIVINQPGVTTLIEPDAPVLLAGGCHPAEGGYSWTDGELTLPPDVFAHLSGPFTVTVEIQRPGMRYPLDTELAATA